MRNAIVVAVLSLVLAAISAQVDISAQAAGSSFGEARVRLFDQGQVVGEWEAVGPGRVDGSTFVFPIRKGARELEVRISGTFSFEQKP